MNSFTSFLIWRSNAASLPKVILMLRLSSNGFRLSNRLGGHERKITDKALEITFGTIKIKIYQLNRCLGFFFFTGLGCGSSLGEISAADGKMENRDPKLLLLVCCCVWIFESAFKFVNVCDFSFMLVHVSGIFLFTSKKFFGFFQFPLLHP